MGIAAEKNSPDAIHPGMRLLFPECGRIQPAGIQSQSGSPFHRMPGMVGSRLGLTDLQQAFMLIGKIEMRLRQPFSFIFLLAQQCNIPQRDRGPFDMFRRSAPYELQTPVDQRRAEPWLDVERAPRIKHPPEPLPDDARRSQGDKMTWADIPAVAIRTVVREIGFLEYGDPVTGFLQIVGAAQPDDPSADDDDIFTHSAKVSAEHTRILTVFP